jgi:hypothetical protein
LGTVGEVAVLVCGRAMGNVSGAGLKRRHLFSSSLLGLSGRERTDVERGDW